MQEVVGTEKVMTRCLNDGVIGQKKGVNLPGKEVNLPAITDKDKVSLYVFLCGQGLLRW